MRSMARILKLSEMTPVIPTSEFIALREDLSALLTDVASKNDANKSLVDVLKLELYGLLLVVSKSSKDWDLDSKLLHSLVSLIQRETRVLQDLLTRFID